MKKCAMTPDHVLGKMKKMGLFALLIALVLTAFGADASGVTLGVAIGAGGQAGGGQTEVPGEPITTDIPNNPEDPSNLLLDNVSKKITEYYRDRNPLNKILRELPSENAKSWTHSFWGLDERPIDAKVTEAYVATVNQTADIKVDNANAFTQSNVLMVKGLPGYDYHNGSEIQVGSLKLEVLSVSVGTNTIKVQTVNGKKSGTTFPVPDIAAGVELIRVGTSLAEIDAQGPIYGDLPKDEFNYLQKFGINVEMTPEFQEHLKQVDFNLSRQISRRLRDMASEQESAILMGSRAIRQNIDKNVPKHYMGGFEFFVDNNFLYDSTKNSFERAEFTAMMQQLYSDNAGSTTRYMFGGSNMASRLTNSTEVIKHSGDITPVEKAGIKFAGIRNLYGDVNFIRHPQFDALGLSDAALVIDVAHASLVKWGGLRQDELDLKGSGQKNVDAFFINEKISLEVNYKDTHMWIKPQP